jgi:hypothetical protein
MRNRSIAFVKRALPSFALALLLAVVVPVDAGKAHVAGQVVPKRPALLQLVNSINDADGIPVIDKDNDTYYQLVSVRKFWPNRYKNDSVRWYQANSLAFAMSFQGRRGRLAIVPNREVYEFLRDTFRIDAEAWIGLRYWCNYKKFTWLNGETHKLSNFQIWGAPWNIGGSHRYESSPLVCSPSVQYWPVHYWRTEYGFNWNANGDKKEMPLFFVEYPPAPAGDSPGS